MGSRGKRILAVACLTATVAFGGAACVGAVSPSPTQPSPKPSLDAVASATLQPTAESLETPGPSPSIESLPSLPLPAGWRSASIPGVDFGPQLAVAGNRLYLAGMNSARDTVIWQSPDGLSWKQALNPGVAKEFVPRAMIEDGRGGVLLAGELTKTEQTAPQIWHSSDGATFTPANLGSAADPAPTVGGAYGAGQIVGLAAAEGVFVAFGDRVVTSLDKSAGDQRHLVAWRSTDGITWNSVDLPGSSGFDARSLTGWTGGFAALGSPAGGKADAVWLSSDGVAWQKAAEIPMFSTGPIVAFRDRLIALGYTESGPNGPAPASWSSTDGRTWRQSVAPSDGLGVMFDGAAVVGDRLVAYGMSHVGSTGVVSDSPASASPAPTIRLMTPTFWLSDDGLTWRIGGPAPLYQPYQSALVSFGGHLVSATVALHQAIVSVGGVP